MSNESRERDIFIAKSMGWEYVPPGPETAEMYGDGVHCLRDPEGRFLLSPWAKTEAETWTHSAPWFHEWESAKAKLLRWIAVDDDRWDAFYAEIHHGWAAISTTHWSRFLVTLPPADVANVAEKVLRGMERSI
jgi:hypothetical protein